MPAPVTKCVKVEAFVIVPIGEDTDDMSFYLEAEIISRGWHTPEVSVYEV